MLNLAVINLKTLKENAIEIKKRLPKTTKFCAVVKANAYGHGLIEVVNALYPLADCFAVSCVEEGFKLRLAGIDKQILVLLPCTLNELECAIENHLTLTVESISQIEKIDKVCLRLKKRAKVHLKVNTGMNRLGCEIEDINAIMQYLNKKPNIILDGVFSHLSNPKSKVSVSHAIDKFLLAINAVKGYNKRVIFHISASGGFLRGEYFDMVRIGILLYGYKPFKDSTIKVKPVMKVYAPVVNTRKISKFDRCLYGNKRAKTNTVSIVRYGYADGLNRKICRGLVNNRCMDLTAVKGKIQGYYCTMANAEKQAKKQKTISYEILCKSALRAQKIYLK